MSRFRNSGEDQPTSGSDEFGLPWKWSLQLSDGADGSASAVAYLFTAILLPNVVVLLFMKLLTNRKPYFKLSGGRLGKKEISTGILSFFLSLAIQFLAIVGNALIVRSANLAQTAPIGRLFLLYCLRPRTGWMSLWLLPADEEMSHVAAIRNVLSVDFILSLVSFAPISDTLRWKKDLTDTAIERYQESTGQNVKPRIKLAEVASWFWFVFLVAFGFHSFVTSFLRITEKGRARSKIERRRALREKFRDYDRFPAREEWKATGETIQNMEAVRAVWEKDGLVTLYWRYHKATSFPNPREYRPDERSQLMEITKRDWQRAIRRRVKKLFGNMAITYPDRSVLLQHYNDPEFWDECIDEARCGHRKLKKLIERYENALEWHFPPHGTACDLKSDTPFATYYKSYNYRLYRGTLEHPFNADTEAFKVGYSNWSSLMDVLRARFPHKLPSHPWLFADDELPEAMAELAAERAFEANTEVFNGPPLGQKKNARIMGTATLRYLTLGDWDCWEQPIKVTKPKSIETAGGLFKYLREGKVGIISQGLAQKQKKGVPPFDSFDIYRNELPATPRFYAEENPNCEAGCCLYSRLQAVRRAHNPKYKLPKTPAGHWNRVGWTGLPTGVVRGKLKLLYKGTYPYRSSSSGSGRIGESSGSRNNINANTTGTVRQNEAMLTSTAEEGELGPPPSYSRFEEDVPVSQTNPAATDPPLPLYTESATASPISPAPAPASDPPATPKRTNTTEIELGPLRSSTSGPEPASTHQTGADLSTIESVKVSFRPGSFFMLSILFMAQWMWWGAMISIAVGLGRYQVSLVGAGMGAVVWGVSDLLVLAIGAAL